MWRQHNHNKSYIVSCKKFEQSVCTGVIHLWVPGHVEGYSRQVTTGPTRQLAGWRQRTLLPVRAWPYHHGHATLNIMSCHQANKVDRSGERGKLDRGDSDHRPYLSAWSLFSHDCRRLWHLPLSPSLSPPGPETLTLAPSVTTQVRLRGSR